MSQQAIVEIHSQLQKYFDALYFCDVNKLNDVFHPDAIYINATDEPILKLDMQNYFAMVSQRISPASKHEARQDKIISIHLLNDQLAVAHVECVISPKYFYDALTFVFDHGEWKIMAKVFQYQLQTG
ncbi:nuclear transport factor 2 family protein [Acinetobacter venetianus]|uniref:nuclear transport factor 2 family protein n=1 Tax=Acinetobacter venetianus TaxID=52133 RepID=UPI00384F552F